jgi:trk system potassium uptake protein
MQSSEIFRTLGNYLLYFALLLLLPTGASIYFEFLHHNAHPAATLAFLGTLSLSLLIAFLFRLIGRKAKGTLYRRESIVLVMAIWISTCFLAAMPFFFTKTLSPLDSFFEAMSGLTTTGSTLISDPSVVLPPLLFWRSVLQWIGGMGIVVLFLTVLPALGVGGKFLYQTEVTGPIKDAIAPRIKETASLLWKLYVSLTFLEVILLLATNEKIPFFDALCISFSNISTGGFSLHADSIAAYSNPATEWIILLFMILGSINFALYFPLIHFQFRKLFIPDFFLFLFFILAGSFLVSYFLVGAPNQELNANPGSTYTLSEAIRSGSFQAVSAQTSTGFFTANYTLWPFPAQMFLFLLMFVGGMSGSTAGGIKTSRFYILYKILLFRIESLFRPQAVRKLIINRIEVDSKAMTTVLSFLCLAVFFSVLGTVFFTLDGIDPATSIGLMASFLNNVGLGFAGAGPTDSLSFLSPFSKILSIFWMLLGRLEYFAVLLIFFPNFWKGK